MFRGAMRMIWFANLAIRGAEIWLRSGATFLPDAMPCVGYMLSFQRASVTAVAELGGGC